MKLAVALLIAVISLMGCQSLAPSIVACPLPVTTQASEVARHLVVGMPRSEAIAALAKAGIRGSLNDQQNIFYCDGWKRDKQTIWHVNVSVMFDEQGKFYAVQPPPNAQQAASATSLE